MTKIIAVAALALLTTTTAAADTILIQDFEGQVTFTGSARVTAAGEIFAPAGLWYTGSALPESGSQPISVAFADGIDVADTLVGPAINPLLIDAGAVTSLQLDVHSFYSDQVSCDAPFIAGCTGVLTTETEIRWRGFSGDYADTVILEYVGTTPTLDDLEPVPEPRSWLLLIPCLCLVWMLTRKRERK